MASRLTRRWRPDRSRRRPLPPRPSRVGERVDDVVGPDPDGAEQHIAVDVGTRLVLAFLTASCTSCGVFWDAARRGAGRGPSPLVIVTPDPTTEDRAEVARRAPADVPVVMSTPAWLAHGVQGSPFFVVVSGGVVRAEGFALTWDELLELIDA